MDEFETLQILANKQRIKLHISKISHVLDHKIYHVISPYKSPAL